MLRRSSISLFAVTAMAALALEAASLAARAQGFTRSSLLVISDPDPMAAFKYQNWSNATNETEAETTVTVNPTNPNNIAAIWRAHDGTANAVSFTLDGGATWQIAAIPGISVFNGGAYGDVSDPWLSFAADGTLYAASIGLGSGTLGSSATDVLISRSADSGRTWSSAIRIGGAPGAGSVADRPAVTPDPGNAKSVYAVWAVGITGGLASVQYTRTTDGGVSWEPPSSIYSPPAGNAVWAPGISVLPDGTLLGVFTELISTGTLGSVPQYNYALTVQRSSDKGRTWSPAVHVAPMSPRHDPDLNDFPWWATVTDPSNKHGIASVGVGNSVAVDRRNGNLYAVWEDASLSGGQYNSIAFSASTDGGRTWSTPIAVNQTPIDIPAASRQAWHPTVAVAADGTIGVTYYDLRFEDTSGCWADYWLVRCTPTSHSPCTDPANWANETRLTDASFNVQNGPGNSQGGETAYWLGDYQGLAAAASRFAAVWGQPYGGSPCRIMFRNVAP